MTKPREVVPEASSAGAEDAARKTPMGIEPEPEAKPATKKSKARKGEE